MTEKRLTAEPPNITEEEFEDSLATDGFLVDYFNEFLSLPTFPEAIRFNADYSIFEVINNAPQLLEKQLKRILKTQQPRNPVYDVIRRGKSDVKPLQKSGPHEDETVNVNYSIMCLSREEGITWVKKERLPAFLESDCYFEYRLAKLISQARWSRTGMNVTIGTDFSPWLQNKPPSQPPPATESDDTIIMKKFYVSLGEASYSQTKSWFDLAKQSQKTMTNFLPASICYNKIEVPAPTITSVTESSIFDYGLQSWTEKGLPMTENLLSHLEEEYGSTSLQDTASQALLRIYLEAQRDDEEHVTLHFKNCEEFLKSYILHILKVAMYQVLGSPCPTWPNDVDFTNVSQVVVEEIKPRHKQDQEPLPEEGAEIPMQMPAELAEKESSKSESLASESRAAWCMSHRTYDIGNRKEFERFKKFIKGTLGEKYWCLWMDIERLKALKHSGRHQRHLEKMKKFYLVSSGDCYLSMEILTKFKLLDGSQWNEEHLTDIQSEVVKPLLLYWAPRFCATHSRSTKSASAKLKFWHVRQERPRKDVDPFPQMATLLPLRPKSCFPRIAEMQKEQSSAVQPPKSPRKTLLPKTAAQKAFKSEPSSQPPPKEDLTDRDSRYKTECNRVFRLTSFTDISECLKPELERRFTYTEETVKSSANGALGGSDMEHLLQSLYVETRAGFFFTKFCEQTGNKLWMNCVYFWFDLQTYHQLFYQETLQPFKICKQAQYLFATYVAPSAPFDIGLQKEKRGEIYKQIYPPFEDLFDTAEEYILLLLLEPWTMMTNADMDTYKQVKLVQETRQLDSAYFRKLQALQKETVFKQTEEAAMDVGHGFLQLPSISKQTEYWNNVPEEFKGFTFNDLLNNKLEFEHFHQFLETHYSSMDLRCWMEIEQFRRIPYIDRSQREAKSVLIKNKYLNKKYFFGPNSPASPDQQNQIMLLNGGWGQILHEHLDASVLLEIQKHVLKRLENVWLPLFLASEQFAGRQKIKIQLQDITEELMLQKQERKIGVWKPVESKWISSSSEIIAFRKALLNPITAKQFQRFVSLKGDLLGNGVLFWQEVQKYKDLCHSHCDEATIQKKITMIINCFINSTIPPTLQIDIPQEQAQKIMEHRKELGPYVFREAQMTIFGVLFKFWPQFCEFRKNLTDEKVLSVLERRQTVKQKKKSVLEDEKFTKESSKHRGSISGSAPKAGTLNSDTGLGMSVYGKQPTWCYSKYIEALEQEKLLLKIQEELEK